MRTKNLLKKGLKMATNDEPLSMGYTGLVNVYSQIKNKCLKRVKIRIKNTGQNVLFSTAQRQLSLS